MRSYPLALRARVLTGVRVPKVLTPLLTDPHPLVKASGATVAAQGAALPEVRGSQAML